MDLSDNPTGDIDMRYLMIMYLEKMNDLSRLELNLQNNYYFALLTTVIWAFMQLLASYAEKITLVKLMPYVFPVDKHFLKIHMLIRTVK